MEDHAAILLVKTEIHLASVAIPHDWIGPEVLGVARPRDALTLPRSWLP